MERSNRFATLASSAPNAQTSFALAKSASSAGQSLPLYKHQVEAISLASAGESYVLTTGTGSGKSLSYFIPVVDACLKAKALDPKPRTRAIVVYPMNALANSQLEELKKFLGADPGIPENFGIISPEGERLRYAQLSVLSDEYSKSVLVGPLLEKLAESVPGQLQEVNGDYRHFRLQMPEAPLTVLTVVIEHPDGRLVPMVNN